VIDHSNASAVLDAATPPDRPDPGGEPRDVPSLGQWGAEFSMAVKALDILRSAAAEVELRCALLPPGREAQHRQRKSKDRASCIDLLRDGMNVNLRQPSELSFVVPPSAVLLKLDPGFSEVGVVQREVIAPLIAESPPSLRVISAKPQLGSFLLWLGDSKSTDGPKISGFLAEWLRVEAPARLLPVPGSVLWSDGAMSGTFSAKTSGGKKQLAGISIDRALTRHVPDAWRLNPLGTSTTAPPPAAAPRR
jgi:hypothetical protein